MRLTDRFKKGKGEWKEKFISRVHYINAPFSDVDNFYVVAQ